MHDAPSTAELVEAVKRFIDDTAAPQLSGHAAFPRPRRLERPVNAHSGTGAAPGRRGIEQARLAALLDAAPDTPLEDLNRDLCSRIQSGEHGPFHRRPAGPSKNHHNCAVVCRPTSIFRAGSRVASTWLSHYRNRTSAHEETCFLDRFSRYRYRPGGLALANRDLSPALY
jgi:hypothetical protein